MGQILHGEATTTHAIRAGRKLYLFVATDHVRKFAVAELHERISSSADRASRQSDPHCADRQRIQFPPPRDGWSVDELQQKRFNSQVSVVVTDTWLISAQ